VAAELACADELRQLAQAAAAAPPRALLRYVPVVTREPGAAALADRIPALIADGRLAAAAGTTLDPSRSRVMVCGNPAMTRELRALLGERGFRPSRRAAPGQVAFEKYW
jgi:ferredoxin--NADP+ reductase